MRVGAKDVHGFDFVKYPALDRIPALKFHDDMSKVEEAGYKFDVIRLHHVIEHLTDHDATLSQLRRLLKPGGKIIGQTPNAAHYTSRLMGSAWGPSHYPYHTLIFSPAGMATAGQRWDLALVHTNSCYLPTAWSITTENLLKRVFNLKTKGRTAIYSFLLAGVAPLAIMDKLVAPKASANFDFVLAAK
jgi:SAM-dependent methyltransferase